MISLWRKGFVGGPLGFIARNSSGEAASDELLSIAVTSDLGDSPTWRPTASSDRLQFTATGTYSISGAQDVTATATWSSGTVGTATIDAAGEATAVSARNGTDGAATTSIITAEIGAISGTTTLSVDVDRDATSGVRIPINAYQLTTLLGIPGTSLRRFNEASGNLVDHIGSKTLTANAAPDYEYVITGWSSVGIAFTGTASQRFIDAAYADAATASSLFIAYVGYTGAPGNSLTMMGFGGSNDTVVTSGSAGQRTFRYRQAANITQMAGTYTEPTVYPLSFRRNLTASTALLATDTEKITPTFGASAGTTFGYGSIIGAGLSAQVAFVWAAEVVGAGAEISDATLKTHLQALGWTVTWT